MKLKFSDIGHWIGWRRTALFGAGGRPIPCPRRAVARSAGRGAGLLPGALGCSCTAGDAGSVPGSPDPSGPGRFFSVSGAFFSIFVFTLLFFF